jgi:hypothetical protein
VGGAVVFGAAALLLLASVGGKLMGIQSAGKILHWEKGEASILGWRSRPKFDPEHFPHIMLDKQHERDLHRHFC